MLKDLKDSLPKWPETVKSMQRGWIGKSTGSIVKFDLEEKDCSIEVFTTRIDTLFGVSFIAISPENTQLDSLISSSDLKLLQDY